MSDGESSDEKNLNLMKEMVDKNAALVPLLLQGLNIVALAVNELSAASKELSHQSRAEINLLRGRTKYFIIVVALLLFLTAITLLAFFGN